MTDEKKIVEVTVTNDGGEQVPVGIMNTSQALSLPEDMDVSMSHPDHDAGETDELIGRDELRSLTEPRIEPVGMRIPAPISEDPSDRLAEANSAVRSILKELIASANEVGWGTQEIAAALIDAAISMHEAVSADPDPASDLDASDAVQAQIGHEEQFD